MARKPINKKTFLIQQLRRLSFKWPPRNEALKRGRVERGRYECNNCKGIFKNGEFVLDHTIPVIDIKYGWVSWDAFIESLFCEVDNFQILCTQCHDEKTKKENEERQKSKKT